ncbi:MULTISPECIES: tyrosine-type recombinase/integrase [Clostridia]|uniref:Tyrosine-type recombinase/integrase n=2 Tax=Clostridia TaxID=186801 RepID=A0A8I0A8D3_9CLOT|nr:MULTISPECIES: tyrosine-type recombinase/integrase [Clostridia]MBC5640067.1 tyrosine-type recombinase/integrase [Clostridium lentum]MBC5655452.1 tyrosine-type recombinase/integrase [Blautia lenta]
MEIKEILQFVKDDIIDIPSALDLLLVYIKDSDKNKGLTILKLVSDGNLKISSAENMINKLIEKEEAVEYKEKKTSIKEVKGKRNRRAARPLEYDEYMTIITLCQKGFTYKDEYGVEHIFRPNKQLAMTFILQANLGLRISDVLKLKPSTFKNDKLEVIEKKTGKLQYRTINRNLKELIYEYALENNIKSNDYLIQVKVRAIQKQLAIIVNYLNLTNISSHSFRKLFGVTVYNKTNGNIELLKELFNHSNISTTQRYIKVSQKQIDEISSSIDFTAAWNI